jgi:tRNA A22 N-methylase
MTMDLQTQLRQWQGICTRFRRMRHLVELAQQAQANNNRLKTIVDIGTDHGLLPIALAATKQFEKVAGIDISQQVLSDGAMALYHEFLDHLVCVRGCTFENAASQLPVDFYCANGLVKVGRGDGDIVCIAGMGVKTMLKIITPAELDRVQCQALLLQPTNSKPRNLIQLYDALQKSGWRLEGERIQKISSRWYISSAFSKTDQSYTPLGTLELPGSKLHDCLNTSSSEMKTEFVKYVKHHCSWLEADKKFGLDSDEQRWRDTFCTRI